MKASDDELSKSFVNVLLRDLKLRPTVVTPTVVAVVVCMVLIFKGLVANVVVLVWVFILGSSDVVGDVDLSALVDVTRVDV